MSNSDTDQRARWQALRGEVPASSPAPRSGVAGRRASRIRRLLRPRRPAPIQRWMRLRTEGLLGPAELLLKALAVGVAPLRASTADHRSSTNRTEFDTPSASSRTM